jgi:preprotein translocase subunit YajC
VAQANGGGAGGGGVLEALFGSPMIPMLITIMVVYFVMVVGPQRKRQKETEKLLAGLKKNDHVVTIGGICGTVVSAAPDSKFITIRVDDTSGAKLRILRSAVSYVGGPEDSAEGKAADA